jgi:hypothetical protein
MKMSSSLTSIGKNIFGGCTGLESIIVESDNTKYDSRDNCNAIIETATNKLIMGCKTTIIPNSVTALDDYAFGGCSGLSTITIPNSVTSIGGYTFSKCNSLTSITIPDSVVTIGNGTFRECETLGSITFGRSVASVGKELFVYCNALTTITSLATTAPAVLPETFSGTPNGGTLYYPSGSDYSSWMSNDEYYLGYHQWGSVEQ